MYLMMSLKYFQHLMFKLFFSIASLLKWISSLPDRRLLQTSAHVWKIKNNFFSSQPLYCIRRIVLEIIFKQWLEFVCTTILHLLFWYSVSCLFSSVSSSGDDSRSSFALVLRAQAHQPFIDFSRWPDMLPRLSLFPLVTGYHHFARDWTPS